MSLGINTNIASLSAQRALSGSQADAATAMQRLSTGLRINSAKDDAAGLAVSNAMTSRINGLQQAGRNSNDAVSMLQTAEGGLQSITDNLQRIRELAVQASNDSLGSTERGYLNTEVGQLINEINRVADSTTFNGQQLLNGTGGTNTDGQFTFQIGAGTSSNDNFAVTLADVNTDAMGASGTGTIAGTAVVADLTAGDLTVNGTDVGSVTAAGTGGTLAGGIAAAIQAADSSVTATVGAATKQLGAFTEITLSGGTPDSGSLFQFSVGGVNIFDTDQFQANSLSVTETEFDSALTSKTSALAAVGITFTGTAAGNNLTFSKADGSDFAIVATTTLDDATAVAGGFANLTTLGAGAKTDDVHGSITLTSASTITLGGAAEANAGFTNDQSSTVTGNTLSAVTVTSRANALAAITSVDNALNTVNTSRASIGANQSRLESVIDNASVTAENSEAARSRILDADFAQESASLAKTQVLQQAGISVLAQANAMPQQVLALLQ